MTVWITRAALDGEKLKAELNEAGYAAIAAPLLEITYFQLKTDLIEAAGGIVLTSRNGLRAIENAGNIEQLKRKPVFAVGEATAKFAGELGFTQIYQGEGTAPSLVSLIVSNAGSFERPLLHLRGRELSFDLKAALRSEDLGINEIIVYQAAKVSELKPELNAALEEGAIDCVMLMSRRTAQIYIEIIKKAGHEHCFSALRHICISSSVAKVLSEAKVRTIEIAKEPTKKAMIDCLNS